MDETGRAHFIRETRSIRRYIIVVSVFEWPNAAEMT
jgi:hypothetical protein